MREGTISWSDIWVDKSEAKFSLPQPKTLLILTSLAADYSVMNFKLKTLDAVHSNC